MFNKLMILSVLSLCGLSLSAPAQRIGFHFGKGGVHLSASADFGHEYRRSGHYRHRARARYRRSYRHSYRHSYRRYYRPQTRYWVEGYYQQVHVPARYGWVDDCGRRVQVVIEPAHYERLWVPGSYQYR